MVRGPGEALLGLHRDPEVGSVVVLGAGGVLAEVYRDVAVRPAPVDLDTAREMVAEVRGFAPLRGYRGLLRGDLGALAAAVAAFSQLARTVSPRVAEAEINPLVVLPEGQGVIAVDGVLRVES